jgi:hypothetical protein
MSSSHEKKKSQKEQPEKKSEKTAKKKDKSAPDVPHVPQEVVDNVVQIRDGLRDLCDNLGNANLEFTDFRVAMPNTPSATPFGLAQAAIGTATDLAQKALKMLDEVLISIQQATVHMETHQQVREAEEGEAKEEEK